MSFETLTHKARLLLELSELAAAREILESVPEALRTAPWWIALEQLRVCLEEDRDQRLVFPPKIPIAERWTGPHLAPDGPEVRQWNPGRVVGLDEEVVAIEVARDRNELTSIEMLLQTLPAEWSVSLEELHPGAFVELVEYSNGAKKMYVWDRLSSSFYSIPNLPPFN